MKNVINRAIMAKKKFIFTLVLAIAGSVWTMSKAVCAIQAPKDLYQVFTTKSGELDYIGYPCEEGMDCPDCLTVALITENNEVYYLTGLNEEQQQMIDKALYGLQNTMWPPKPVKATVSGTPYQNGSFDFIKVLDIVFETEKLPSLCDTWNVLNEPYECDEPHCYLRTNIYRLKADTIIQDLHYFKLMEEEGSYTYYKGALREGSNRDIYYVPENSTNEYLIYAFNAQVGDELENVWLGGEAERINCASAHNATVIAISNSNPRIFTLEVIPYTSYEGMEVYPYRMNWIEGVGMSDGPVGAYDSNKLCLDIADLGVFTLLCAYKNGEQVYSSSKAEKYGCKFNGYDVLETPTDSIPLFVQDDSGSSTVDPVDPNQVVATLRGDRLTIHENMGVDITYSLHHNAPAQAPAQHRSPQSDTFRDEVTISITESGEYLLQLTNPSWGYTIFGRFNYSPQDIENISPASAPQKIMKNGQIFILRGDKTYTLTGQEMR